MGVRDLAPINQWTEPQTGARVASTVYFIFDGTNWSPSDTGPADGYQDLVTDHYEVSTTASSHDGLAMIVNGVAISR